MSTTYIGNLTRDPEIKFTNNGNAVCSFAVAVTKKRGEEEYVSYFDCSAWGSLAENVTKTLKKGDRVVVFGTLTQDRFEKDGQKRSSVNLTVEAVGPDLRWATAVIDKGEFKAPVPKQTASTDPF